MKDLSEKNHFIWSLGGENYVCGVITVIHMCVCCVHIQPRTRRTTLSFFIVTLKIVVLSICQTGGTFHQDAIISPEPTRMLDWFILYWHEDGNDAITCCLDISSLFLWLAEVILLILLSYSYILKTHMIMSADLQDFWKVIWTSVSHCSSYPWSLYSDKNKATLNPKVTKHINIKRKGHVYSTQTHWQ